MSIENSSTAPIASGFLTGSEVLATLFPNKATRPTMAWLYRSRKAGVIPFIRLNRKVLFEAEKVREALRKFEVTGPL